MLFKLKMHGSKNDNVVITYKYSTNVPMQNVYDERNAGKSSGDSKQTATLYEFFCV